MRVLHDRILVLLPPNPAEQQNAAGLFLAAALPPPVSYGRVVRRGPLARDVRDGDLVAFPSTAGDPVDVAGHDCLFLRETECVAYIRKSDVEAIAV